MSANAGQKCMHLCMTICVEEPLSRVGQIMIGSSQSSFRSKKKDKGRAGGVCACVCRGMDACCKVCLITLIKSFHCSVCISLGRCLGSSTLRGRIPKRWQESCINASTIQIISTPPLLQQDLSARFVQVFAGLYWRRNFAALDPHHLMIVVVLEHRSKNMGCINLKKLGYWLRVANAMHRINVPSSAWRATF